MPHTCETAARSEAARAESASRPSTRPASVRTCCRPDRIPAVVGRKAVLADDPIGFHAARVDAEDEARVVIVIRIDRDLEEIGLGRRVSASELSADAVRGRSRVNARRCTGRLRRTRSGRRSARSRARPRAARSGRIATRAGHATRFARRAFRRREWDPMPDRPEWRMPRGGVRLLACRMIPVSAATASAAGGGPSGRCCWAARRRPA